LNQCRMRGGDDKSLSSGVAAPPLDAPVLLPPQSIPSAVGGLAIVGAVAALIAGALMFGDSARVPGPASPGKPHAIIALGADRVPGAFKILPANFQNSPARVLAQLNMPEAEKRRLAEKLADGTVRLAAVTLWDTVDEDGDTVEVSAATFSQTLVIMHKPAMFFVPLQQGGTVSIRAVRDGGGGGVTLGVSTIVGPVVLPPLAVGQVVEIPAL